MQMSDDSRISRRTFVRNATAGAAGAALAASAAPFASAAGKMLGEITLDGMMITYFGAPYGDAVTTKYTFSRAYGTTFGLASTKAPEFALRASVPAGKEKFFSGLSWLQSESEHVRGALSFVAG